MPIWDDFDEVADLNEYGYDSAPAAVFEDDLDLFGEYGDVDAYGDMPYNDTYNPLGYEDYPRSRLLGLKKAMKEKAKEIKAKGLMTIGAIALVGVVIGFLIAKFMKMKQGPNGLG